MFTHNAVTKNKQLSAPALNALDYATFYQCERLQIFNKSVFMASCFSIKAFITTCIRHDCFKMFFALTACTILALVNGSCDLCDCSFPIVTCSGPAITTFVFFGADESMIETLIYDSTLITELPVLNDTFKQLQSLNLYRNSYLKCSEILTFEQLHPDIYVSTDLLCLQSTSDAPISSAASGPATDATLESTSADDKSTAFRDDTTAATIRRSNQKRHVLVPIMSSLVVFFITITLVLGVVYFKIRKTRQIEQPLRLNLEMYTNDNYLPDSQV